MDSDAAFASLWRRHEELSQRFAQLLHDDAGQVLTALALRLSALEGSLDSREEIQQIQHDLDGLLERFRDAQASLGSAIVAKRGLLAALSQLARHTGTLRVEGSQAPAWPAPSAQAAFRLIESLAPSKVQIDGQELVLYSPRDTGPLELAWAAAGNLFLQPGSLPHTIKIKHADSSPRR